MQTIDIEYLNPNKGSKILDLGCGQGRHCFGAYMFVDADVFGFDMSHEDVSKAKENFKDFDESSPIKAVHLALLTLENFLLKAILLIT